MQITPLSKKTTSRKGEKYLQIIYLIKVLVFKNSYDNMANNPIKKQWKGLNRHFSKDIQTVNKHMKRCSTSLSVGKCKSKPNEEAYLGNLG